MANNVNIKNLLTTVQRRVSETYNDSDARTDVQTSDLLYLFDNAQRADKNTVYEFASEANLPDALALDSDYRSDQNLLTDPVDFPVRWEGTRIAYTKDSKKVYLRDSDGWNAFQGTFSSKEFPGINFGAVAGGGDILSSYSNANTIELIPFGSTVASVNVGNLPQKVIGLAGQSSETSGYTSGGRLAGDDAPVGPNTNMININKYSFASFGDATEAGNLSRAKTEIIGHSSKEYGYGYVSGGQIDASLQTPSDPAVVISEIEKFRFSSSVVSGETIGDLSTFKKLAASQNSLTNGFTSGGINDQSAALNVIDKFSFVADNTSAFDAGDLSVTRFSTVGMSSPTEGFTSGGISTTPGVDVNTVDKFPLTAEVVSATDAGDLTSTLNSGSAQSSTTFGYQTGGSPLGNPATAVIQKFEFAGFVTASNIATLSGGAKSGGAGHQS